MAGVQLQQPTMTDYRLPMHHQPPPTRKPVAGMHSGFPFQAYDGPHQQQLSPHPSAASLAHNRRRTSSSHVLPYMAQQAYSGGPSPHHTMTGPPNYPPSRRLSSATTSTTSTGNVTNSYYGGNPHTDIRRSTSSRSANAQLGYVALMRRQKATVWCDRAQPEDPRLRAQKLVDKKRAYLEVHGAGAGRTGTLGSGKNKHGGKGTTDFSPSTLVGATVPVRLSANEVGDADEDAHSDRGFPYRRTGSGRSSLGSNSRYPSGYQRTPQSTMGSNSTPPNEKTDLPDVSEHPPAESHETEQDHASIKDDAATTNSFGSEHEEYFGTVGDMAAPSAASAAIEKAKKADELRRRGSVDDRTTSMTNVRLFVANPDLSD
ncbi:uncharacterized protein BO80DRAFT_353348 [Aspergillus ibericus CBS 121593]|uniref:Uncharacterized protein n=1 Tax=Aspergillus ibericus CBS 121593 TaxID=1448316 RepID=A0A395H289_9EURO|nr:hypothetical protein BO80DRAFT_353348 [Aspergillus ibericus CBS 121593]RAL01997.1 hypothetical protein BO80DRAFT_353348 [Aspergillus ibericus CBS 121593]